MTSKRTDKASVTQSSGGSPNAVTPANTTGKVGVGVSAAQQKKLALEEIKNKLIALRGEETGLEQYNRLIEYAKINNADPTDPNTIVRSALELQTEEFTLGNYVLGFLTMGKGKSIKKSLKLGKKQKRVEGNPKKKKEDKKDKCKTGKAKPTLIPTGYSQKIDSIFILHGLIDIVVSSTYVGNLDTKGPNGWRRASDLDAILEKAPNGRLRLIDAEAFPVLFDRPTPNPNHWVEGDNVRPLFLQAGRKRSYILREEGRYKHFHKCNDNIWRVFKEEDRNGNALTYERDDQNKILSLTNPEGLKLCFEYNEKGLRTRVILVAHDGEKREVLRYCYDAQDNLVLSESRYGNRTEYRYDKDRNLIYHSHNSSYQAQHDFDSKGRVLRYHTSNAYNNAHFHYDDEKRITTFWPGADDTVFEKFYYNEFENITAEANALGHIKRTYENELGYVAKEVDAEGNETAFSYDHDGNIKSITDGEGRTSFYAWDEDGNLEILIDPEGNSWDYHYDEKGNLVAIEDANRFRTDINNNAQGQPVGVMRHDGLLQQYGYDKHHRVSVLSDFNGGKTCYQRDNFGRITQITDALGVTTKLEYRDQPGWDFWQASKITRSDGNTIEYVSQERGTVTTIEGGERRNTYKYDAFGNLLKVTDAGGNDLNFHYDSLERIEKITNQNGLDWTFERDGAGRIIKECDFDEQSFEYDYDAADRVIEVTRNDGGRTCYAYDKSDLIVEEAVYAPGTTEPDVVSFEYNDRGLLAKVSNANSVVEYEYNANGEVIAESANGFRIESDIDCCGQRSQRRILDLKRADEPEDTSALAEGLRALAEMRGDGAAAQAGQLLQQVDYLYDPLGGLKEFRLGGKTEKHAPLQFTRDVLGRELTRASASGFSLAQQWDAMGQLQSQQAGRALSGVPDVQGNPVTPRTAMSRRYGWNKFFEPTSINDQRWGATRFNYDARGQISEGAFSDGYAEKFSYDPAQNIASVTEQSGPISRGEGSDKQSGYTLFLQDYRARKSGAHKTADQLLNWTTSKGGRVEIARGTLGERIALEYDSRGRVIQRLVERDGFRPQRWRFNWDGRDRLVSVIVPSGDKWAYTYDPLGRRLEKIRYTRSLNEDGELGEWRELRRISTLWDGDVPVWEEEAGNRIEWHFEPDSFAPLARQQGEQLCYVVTDHLGTPREILSEAGAPVWAADYTTWGQLRRLWQGDNDNSAGDQGPFQGYDSEGKPVYSTNVYGRSSTPTQGALAIKASSEPDPYFCPIRFQGQWADEETGLYYNRFRYYDPQAAQYMSPDPIGIAGGIRSNGYVEAPLTWLDQLGLKPIHYPSWKRVKIDMHHIMDRHHPLGTEAMRRAALGKRNDVFPEFMNEQTIQRLVREAYKCAERVRGTQRTPDGEKRTVLRGKSKSGVPIEMWYNVTNKTIETAYPKFGFF